MDEFRIYISDMMQNKLDVVKESILTTFCINYCNDNMIRAMYVNSQTMSELCCSEDTNVVFAVRNDTCILKWPKNNLQRHKQPYIIGWLSTPIRYNGFHFIKTRIPCIRI